MKLIKMNCPNCDAPFDVVENQKKVKCKYCQTTVFLDDESVQVNHTVYNGNKKEELKNAAALLKLKEYEDAFEHYQLLSKKYIYEAEIWYCLVLCLTEEFTNFGLDYINCPIVDTDVCREYLEKYEKLETNESLKIERIKEYEDYEKQLFKLSDEAEVLTSDVNGNVDFGAFKVFIFFGIVILILLIVVAFLSI